MINKLLENKLRSFIPLNAKRLIIHLYFYLGSNGTISNLKNKANYSLKSGPIFKDHKNISVQHRQWNKSGKPTKAYNPVSFEKWFLVCLRKCEKKGAEFTFLCPGLVRISWHDKVSILRTVADFEREFQNDYLSKFKFFLFPKVVYVALHFRT
jgi:hypothetical protein